MAGNTLDKASLLSGLLQAAGFTTRYMHAYLYDPSTLIRTMFPPNPVLLGCLPPGTPVDDPGFHGFAQNDSHDYYWVQYGPGNINLDPNLPNGQPGQTLMASDSNFTTIPQNLRQQITVSVKAEMYSQASALFGLGPGTTTVSDAGVRHLRAGWQRAFGRELRAVDEPRRPDDQRLHVHLHALHSSGLRQR